MRQAGADKEQDRGASAGARSLSVEELETDLLAAIDTEHTLSVANRYAEAIRVEQAKPGNVRWRLVNEAIMARWSKNELVEIKRLAWSLLALQTSECHSTRAPKTGSDPPTSEPATEED